MPEWTARQPIAKKHFFARALFVCICCLTATFLMFGLQNLYEKPLSSHEEFEFKKRKNTRALEKARYAIRVSDALNADNMENMENFQRATPPATIQFPEDHGLHLDFKTEWWYFTGNLQTASGREFGYQLTFFRSALAPNNNTEKNPPQSTWATRQIFMGHFAVTDKANGAFFHTERFTRMSAGLAGCELFFKTNAFNNEEKRPPFKIWLYDWNVQTRLQRTTEIKSLRLQDSLQDKSEKNGEGNNQKNNSATIFPLELCATLQPEDADGENEIELTLRLDSVKPVVLQGENGYSPKSMSGANASYYYSHTRLATQGEIRIGAKRFALNGLSWLDREWSTSALEKNQTGWDWFSLQLDDGSDVMFYRLRQRTENNAIVADSASSGVLVRKDGSTKKLHFRDVHLTPQTFWQSPVAHTIILNNSRKQHYPVYPAIWRFSAPTENLELTLTPLVANQELLTSVRYWEGAVKASGTRNNKTISGKGYVEMTGYADE